MYFTGQVRMVSLESHCKMLLNVIGLSMFINQNGRSIKDVINCVKQTLLTKDQETWRAMHFNDSSKENGNKLRIYRLIYKHV